MSKLDTKLDWPFGDSYQVADTDAIPSERRQVEVGLAPRQVAETPNDEKWPKRIDPL